MSKQKPPPDYNPSCPECHMLGEACQDHRVNGAAGDAGALEQEVLALLQSERAVTVSGREEVARKLAAMVLLGFPTDRADAIAKQLAMTQREKKPAGDAWGETGDKVRELLGVE